MSELVSIGICTYNRYDLVCKLLDILFKQSYQKIEIIVVNDNSDDKRYDFLGDIYDIKYIKNTRNLGLAKSRNLLIENSKGYYFTFIDDDDLVSINYIEEFVNISRLYKGNTIFYCGYTYLNRHKKIVNVLPRKDLTLRECFIQGITPPVAGQFYPLSLLKKVKGYNENIRSGVDHDLWIRLLEIDDLRVISIPLPLSQPNSIITHDRMTTNYIKRKNGINESLKIWRPYILSKFNEDFFKHFSKCYNQYICLNFFRIEVMKRHFFKAILLFFKSPFKYFFIKKLLKSKYYETFKAYKTQI